MIKNILIAIGDQPHEKNAFDYAGQLAVLLDAHLSCVFFYDNKGTGPEDMAKRVLEQTRAECDLYDFLDCHVEAVIGKPTDMICQKAQSADLVVIGIPESIKTDGLKLIYDQIDDVLLNITKPTVVVHEQCTLLRKILTVHQGDSYSSHVLELSAELGERTEASLLGLALAETQLEAARITQQMRDYLQFYKVNTEFMMAFGFTVTNILETAAAQDCDLIALSASRHGRLYQMIFQGTTETVVKLANRAVVVVR
ncbi:MAG: universal stress protein [Candidatus Poribacteria bacterium]|nr:universal stress protein [Candidatus Poribacteria bacterium]